jgi:hypothetical protein
MVNKKSELSADRKELSSRDEKAQDLENVEQESGDGKKGIFVRVSPTAKTALEKAAKGQTTYAKVIEALLEYFGDQPPSLQEKILKRINITPVKELENLMAKMHRAQHAYENKRYYYAVKTYKEIVGELKNVDSSEELLEVCNYRLGHSWIRLSYDLRKEALSYDGSKPDSESRYEEIYSIALRTLDRALYYLGELREEETDILTWLIKHYNMACCHSLKAQYLVESKLEAESGTRADLREALKDTQNYASATLKVWRSFGENWRKKNGEDFAVDREAEKALGELKKMYSQPTASGDDLEPTATSNLSPERIWVVETATDDTDFIFLRTDKKVWKPRFDEWAGAALTGDNSIAKAIDDLLQESDVQPH